MAEQADTVPGFTMQSERFYLKFVTGMQCGVSSKLLEYETDWYEVMEILLSRLEDEPENQPDLERIAGRDLEFWAAVQPGGDTLNLKIQVRLEEKRYFLPPMGMRKTLKLTFNDRFTTQVLFHVKKKQMLRSLKYMSAVVVAASLAREEGAEVLGRTYQLPRCLVPWVRKAWHNCWTARYFKAKLPGCPDFCACKQSRVEKEKKNKEVKERKTKNSQKSQGSIEMEAKSRAHCKAPAKAKATPANAQKNKKQAPVKGAVVKTKVSTSDKEKAVKKREDRIEKLNNKVKCLEKEMLNRFEVTKKSLEDDKGAPKRMSIGNKKENEFAKLQHKYKVMQTKYKALKKEQVVKNNLQNLQQKYKALEAKFKNLKQKDKTESESGECKETPAKRVRKDLGKLSKQMHPKSGKPLKAPKVLSEEPKSSKAFKKSSPLFKCEQCLLDFSLISQLRKHMKTGCTEDKSIPEPASKRRRRG